MTRVSLSSDGGAVMSTSVTARERVAMESGKAPTMERENNSEKEQGQGSGSKSETGGPARAGAPVEELLGRLNLEEEEDAGFVWEEEVKDHEAKAKWLAIAKVHTERGFSPSALYADMRSAWNPAKEVAWRKIEDNLFTIQFACLGDWNKAMLQGPWVFRNQAVMIEEYDGFANPRSIVLDKITVWAQVLKLPNMLLKESVIRGAAKEDVNPRKRLNFDAPNNTDGILLLTGIEGKVKRIFGGLQGFTVNLDGRTSTYLGTA
ncbi:hypothetical protein ACQ4PT_002069 [Festuca glaucescens]